MIAYEAAKLLEISNKEFLETYGIKSHLSKISTDLEAELFGDEKKTYEAPETVTQTVDSAETVIVGITADVVKRTCPYTVEQVRNHIRQLGNKSACWEWRHILDG